MKNYLDDVVVAPFNMVISNYGEIIIAVNKKYGKEFKVFEHSKENVKLIFDERISENKKWGRENTAVPVPSMEKNTLKEKIIPELNQLDVSSKAIELFEYITKRAK